LQDLKPCLPKREILAIRARDQPIEHGVLEHAPPLADVFEFTADALVIRINPALCNWRSRRRVVGADLKPVVDIFAQRGAAGDSGHETHCANEATKASAWSMAYPAANTNTIGRMAFSTQARSNRRSLHRDFPQGLAAWTGVWLK